MRDSMTESGEASMTHSTSESSMNASDTSDSDEKRDKYFNTE